MSTQAPKERKKGKYTLVQTADGTWKRKNIFIWEAHYGRTVPAKHIIIFKDGDFSNFAIENLECVPNNYYLMTKKDRHVKKPIGSERQVGKFVLLKIAENLWKPKHIHLWEDYHKLTLPQNSVITFKDKDCTNFAIDNLICIPRHELFTLNSSYNKRSQKSIGAEHKSGNKIKLKITETEWKSKHTHIWETHHNMTVPQNHVIIFKDKNCFNFDIENLECISRSDLYKRLHIERGSNTKKRILTNYKPKKIAHPIGSERKKNHTYVKIDNDTWKLKQVLLWEEYNGVSMPKNHFIYFKDNDKTNFSKENLMCVPLNYFRNKPIGSERKIEQEKDGHTLIKVGHKTWKRKHIHVWEEYHRSAVPPGHVIRFKDNNPHNCSIENLECIPKTKFLAYGRTKRTHSPIGSERPCGNYTLIKTEASTWKGKHIHIWEEHHQCPVPDGCTIRFRDNDYTNFAIENLQCVMTDKQSQNLRYEDTIPRVKVGDNKWRRKHVLIWEEHHKKPVPRGYDVIFLDRDYTNFSVDNLECVPAGVFNSVVQRKLLSPNSEMSRAHLLITHMKSIVKSKNKLFKPKNI